jgi:hypothetical protein
MPQLDRIQLRRPSAEYTATIFSKGTNDYNHFTLLELIAVHYGFLSTKTGPPVLQQKFNLSSYTAEGSLAFPSLEKIVIRRPNEDGKGWNSVPVVVDLNRIFQSSLTAGCPDLDLQWGDVVEIAEADHPTKATWKGFPEEALSKLSNCLKRQIQVTVKGQTTNIVLEIRDSHTGHGAVVMGYNNEAWIPGFSLLAGLDGTGLLRVSSDLSHVKVRRRNPATGQDFELVLDCSNPGSPPNLWLRNGDAIEVPEKVEQP